MALSGNNFIYNNTSSDSYGELFFAQVETEDNRELGGNITYTTYQNNNSPIISIQSTKYATAFSYEVEFVSQTKLDDNMDNIAMWLLNQTEYKKMYVDSESLAGKYFNCYFTNAQIGRYGDGIHVIKATMVCDSNFIWENKTEYKYTKAQLLNIVTHNNRSFVRGYAYPKLTITVGTIGGDITLQNVTDGSRLVSFTDTYPNENIIMTYFPKLITSNLREDSLIYEQSNRKFLFVSSKTSSTNFSSAFGKSNGSHL